MPKSFLNNHLIRGLRNNNPGNLKRGASAWQGKIPFPQSKDKTFEQFSSVAYGIRAMYKDLIHDINKGKNTVKSLISEYAPKEENNTEAYINKVCKTLGIKPTDKLTSINSAFLLVLGRAIVKVEIGKDHVLITDDDLKEGLSLLGDVSTKSLTVNIMPEKIKPFIPAIIFVVVFFCSLGMKII